MILNAVVDRFGVYVGLEKFERSCLRRFSSKDASASNGGF